MVLGGAPSGTEVHSDGMGIPAGSVGKGVRPPTGGRGGSGYSNVKALRERREERLSTVVSREGSGTE